MFRSDYLVRLIQQATAALAVVLGLRRAGRHADALAEIDRLLHQEFGLDLGFLAQLDIASLLKLVSWDQSPDIGKCLVLADLLQAEGEIHAELGRPAEHEDRALKALALLLEVAHASDDTALPALAPRIETVSHQLTDAVFPADLNDRLGTYYDRLGPPASAPLEL